MTKNATLLTVIALFGIVSCSDEKSINPDASAPTATYLFDYNPGVDEIPTSADRWYPMESAVHFSISEGYSPYPQGSPCDPMFMIDQETDDEYFAYNFSIIVDVETAPGLIRIMYQSVYIGNFTLDALGPAHTRSYFNVPDGKYTLQLERAGLVDKYELVAKAEAFQIRPLSNAFTRNDNDVAGRYIPGSFGLYWSGNEGEDSLFEDIAQLLLEDSEIVELKPENQPLNPLWSARPIGGDIPPRMFSYSKNIDFSVVRALLHRAVLDRYQLLHTCRIAAVSWRNERFDSRNYQ